MNFPLRRSIILVDTNKEILFYTMIETILFFGGLVVGAGVLAVACSHLTSPYEKARELEEIKRDQRAFWTSHMN